MRIDGQTYQYPAECVTTSTPWGRADVVTRYERGLNFCSTPGHGGFKLSEKLNARIPSFIRHETFGGLGVKGWYEEDEDAQIVIVAFGHLFNEQERKHAVEYLTAHHPAWMPALLAIATVGGTVGTF
jgi:hypothetical protein